MVSAEKFVGKVEEIYQEDPDYESGGDGSGHKCDCIGMPRGALERAGEKNVHNMRGTNNAVRHLDLNLRQLTGSSQLQLGDIVMRTRDKDDKNMRLPDKYRKGGSDYSEKWGETNFTHIGTVTSVYPLVITHMNDPKAQKDTSIKNWEWFGQLPWVEYGSQPEPGPDPDPDPPEPARTATVWSENGKPVNTRKGPNETYGQSRAGTIPVGDTVQIDAETTNDEGETWCKCEWTTRKGVHWVNFWVKKDFLIDDQDEPEPDPTTTLYTVHIPFLTADKAKALIRNYPGSWKTVDEAVG